MVQKRFTFIWSALLLIGLGAALPNSVAAAIITGESATASTVRGDGAFSPAFQPIGAVNDTGLSGGSHAPNNFPGMWLSHNSAQEAADPDPWFRVDLGDVYDITSFHVWNYNEGGGGRIHGLKNVDLYYSSSDPTVDAGDSLLGAYVFTNADDTSDPMTGAITGDNFLASFTARYIYLDINSNYGGTAYGLSEIQFSGTLVPEPSTIALAGLGFVGLISTARRRRRQG